MRKNVLVRALLLISHFIQRPLPKIYFKNNIFQVANIMMALTALGCVIMIWSGKQAAERGETVHKMNVDWHKSYNEKTGKKETDFNTHFDKIAEAGSQSQK